MSEPEREAAGIRLLGVPVFRREDFPRLVFAAAVILTALAAWNVPRPFYDYLWFMFRNLQFPSALAVFVLGYGIIVPYIIGEALLRLYFWATWENWPFGIHWLWHEATPPVFIMASGALLLFVSTKLPWKNKEYGLLRSSWRPLTAWLVSLALILAIAYFEPSAWVYFSGTHAALLFMCIAIAAGVETCTMLWACGMRRTAIANCLFWCTQAWFLVDNATNWMWSIGFLADVRT